MVYFIKSSPTINTHNRAKSITTTKNIVLCFMTEGALSNVTRIWLIHFTTYKYENYCHELFYKRNDNDEIGMKLSGITIFERRRKERITIVS